MFTLVNKNTPKHSAVFSIAFRCLIKRTEWSGIHVKYDSFSEKNMKTFTIWNVNENFTYRVAVWMASFDLCKKQKLHYTFNSTTNRFMLSCRRSKQCYCCKCIDLSVGPLYENIEVIQVEYNMSYGVPCFYNYGMV